MLFRSSCNIFLFFDLSLSFFFLSYSALTFFFLFCLNFLQKVNICGTLKCGTRSSWRIEKTNKKRLCCVLLFSHPQKKPKKQYISSLFERQIAWSHLEQKQQTQRSGGHSCDRGGSAWGCGCSCRCSGGSKRRSSGRSSGRSSRGLRSSVTVDLQPSRGSISTNVRVGS